MALPLRAVAFGAPGPVLPSPRGPSPRGPSPRGPSPRGPAVARAERTLPRDDAGRAAAPGRPAVLVGPPAARGVRALAAPRLDRRPDPRPHPEGLPACQFA